MYRYAVSRTLLSEVIANLKRSLLTATRGIPCDPGSSRHHDPIVALRLRERTQNAKYTQHSIHNHVIHAAAGIIRERIAAETSGTTTSSSDESLILNTRADVTRIEIRSVGVNSHFYSSPCKSLDASGLCETLLKSLRDCGIDLLGCVAQCFDGESVMSDALESDTNPQLSSQAMYVHCLHIVD